jgi:hypothetical protein
MFYERFLMRGNDSGGSCLAKWTDFNAVGLRRSVSQVRDSTSTLVVLLLLILLPIALLILLDF